MQHGSHHQAPLPTGAAGMQKGGSGGGCHCDYKQAHLEPIKELLRLSKDLANTAQEKHKLATDVPKSADAASNDNTRKAVDIAFKLLDRVEVRCNTLHAQSNCCRP